MRSRSNTSSTKSARLSRSRGSTTSIHSATTQFHPDVQQQPQDVYGAYMRPQYAPSQVPYHPNPEEMILRYGEQFGHAGSARLDDPALQENHNNAVRSRPDMQLQEHLMRNRTLSAQPSQPTPPPGHIPAEFTSNHFPHMFDTTENHTPDRMLEDNEGSEVGPRKRRGTSSSIANDNELRRLLRQYDGYSLQDMAAEVRKNEGAGGKSEKVKQVFAMIWLRENCLRGNGSVRRDRVYCCYAEKCGNDRVSVLNPASFGKLVRIIFPNVQTRRLGVRGESKYHYVDLSLIGQDIKPEFDDKTDKAQIPGSQLGMDGSAPQLNSSFAHNPHQPQKSPIETSDTTSSASNILHQQQSSGTGRHCSCAHSDSVSEMNLGVDSMAVKTQLKIQHILHFEPTDGTPSTESDTLSLPNIHQYLPDNPDPSAADALAALYRSHCTSVIDSFRFCKEKNLFRHFSAFQGTLTVPVHKLLVHPNVAPWVEECDWLMYQKMLAFVSPLTTQVVPDPVLKAFRSISCKLVTHIAETLKSQPDHVSTARIIPCRLFCHLLKRMLDVNQSANAAAAWLCHLQNRNKMWEEFSNFVDPAETVIKANIPPCSVKTAITILKEHMKSLLYPLDNCSPPQTDPLDGDLAGFSLPPTNTEEYTNFPDRWIAFILQLPTMFPDHSATCMIEKADALWTTVLHRLTLAGAESFSAWWMTKVFFLEMMQWQAERGGFMASSPKSLREHSTNLSNTSTAAVAAQLASFTPANNMSSQQTENEQSTQEAPSPNMNNDMSNNASKTNKADAPNRPAVDTSLEASQLNNDDSAIALEDDSVLLGTSKYTDMTLSDPADAEGDVIVV
ncbi:RfxA [Arthroderma uncinatum]|uniref:RfxA n=1 Tax=Arthroderma uncinatum TaxID=74035 RepID=UPI00144A75A8|nr:RfxA [Arthroderma uncinatum]KAF3482392.1 RfxA [Arthroderma uncinatum]